MKRRELLAMPELTATDEMITLAKKDRGRSRKLYFWETRKHKVYRIMYSRALVSAGILKVAFFCREDLIADERKARYEVYISADEKNDMTYLPQERKWSGAAIGRQTVTSKNQCFSDSHMEDWDEDGAGDLVRGYLSEPGKISVFHAVDTCQQRLRVMRLRGRHQREKELIDMAMDQVPALPADWEDWVYKSAYSHRQYMMYHYGDKNNRAWCTACGHEVSLKKKAKHQKHVRCPACGKKVIALSWNRQKQIADTVKPAILQARKDYGYVLRIFDSKIVRWKEDDWKLSTRESYISERYRIFLDDEFRQETIYEYTFFKNRRESADLRWCHETIHGYGYYYNEPGECILYYRNLAKLRKGTVLQYIPIEKLYRKNEGCFSYPVLQIYALKVVPQHEYLIKMGLYRLVWDLSTRGNSSPPLIDNTKRKPWEVLKIDRQLLDMAVKMNITALQLHTLQKAYSLNIRLTRQQLEWYARELGPDITKEVLLNGHPVKMMRYIQSLTDRKIRASDYVDYLEDIRILQIVKTDDVLFPKNFESAHERLSEQRRDREEQIRQETIREKDRMLWKMQPDLNRIYRSIEDDSFIMVIPTCKEDFIREGQENHNCVGGSYFDKMLEGKCVVAFLRRKEDPGKAFCTVEMDGSRIVQCRAVRNSAPPKVVEAYMERYRREVEKRIMKKANLERVKSELIMAAK